MLIQDSQDYGAADEPRLMETIGAATERAARLWPEMAALACAAGRPPSTS